MTRWEIALLTVFKCRYCTYTEAARRVLDFIDDDREEIIRFLGNGILSPIAVCIRVEQQLRTVFRGAGMCNIPPPPKIVDHRYLNVIRHLGVNWSHVI